MAALARSKHKMSATITAIRRVLIVSLAVLASNFVAHTQGDKSRPRVVPPQEIPKVIRAIPSYTRFSFSGLSFFNKKLYASSNIGLLEFDGGTLSKLYKWNDSDDVVSGPWLDVANNSLWVMHDGLNQMIRYDGTAWHITEPPRPKEGFSRGDVLAGFRGAGTPEGFWLEGGGHAWRWDSRGSVWEPVRVPPDGSLARIVPLPNTMLLVMRHASLDFLVKKGQDFKSDTVHYYQDSWKEVPNKTGKSFFAKQVVVIKDVGYILTRDGLIFRVNPTEIAALDAPGECEAIAATTSGTLLAGLRNSGVYEYAGGWQKRFSAPYSSTEAEHWSYLARSDGPTAFAITSMPKLDEDKRNYPGQTTLWISSGGELREAKVGER
jgi:hypothetical protein